MVLFCIGPVYLDIVPTVSLKALHAFVNLEIANEKVNMQIMCKISTNVSNKFIPQQVHLYSMDHPA
jgi:hypothetical protein